MDVRTRAITVCGRHGHGHGHGHGMGRETGGLGGK